eukprot:scaffold1016_cov175-Ochromonas_danica.AAC.3
MKPVIGFLSMSLPRNKLTCEKGTNKLRQRGESLLGSLQLKYCLTRGNEKPANYPVLSMEFRIPQEYILSKDRSLLRGTILERSFSEIHNQEEEQRHMTKFIPL